MRLHFALLWLLAALLHPAAQSDGPAIGVQVGFAGLYKEGAAVPIVVSLRNDGPPLDGEIQATLKSGGDGQTVYSAPVSLPTQSDKRVALTMHVRTYTSGIDVRFVVDGQAVASTSVTRLTVVNNDDLLYGVVTPDAGELAFLETIDGGRPGAEVAFLQLDDLPEIPIAWRALDVVVLDDVDTGQLTARQLAALRAWVENGGHLVVTGGAGGPKTAAALADLLPVAVGGTESVPALPALEEFAGLPGHTDGPFVLTTAEVVRGQALIAQDGRPLLAQSTVGLGRVTFLALDPKAAPLAGWGGRPVVWDAIVSATPSRGPWGNGIQDSYTSQQAASTISGLHLPSVAQLVLFLMVYTLVIGPINFLVLRRLKRRELAWVTVPALVLLFSIVTYFIGFRTRGSTVLNEMSVVYGAIDGQQVRTQSIVGLYSPGRGRYSLSLPYDATAAPAESLSPGQSNIGAIVRAGDLALSDIRADTGQVVLFLVDAFRPRPPLAGEARLDDGARTVIVTVRNEGDAVFENAVLLYGDQQRSLGNLAAGEEREARLVLAAPAAVPAPDPLVPTGVFVPNPLLNDPSLILGTANYYNDPQSYGRWQLLQSLYTYGGSSADQAADPTQRVTLAGWLPGPAQPIDAGDAPLSQEGQTLVLLEIPVR